MKIKNLKIALVAVFGFVGISAFAQDAKYENVNYTKLASQPAGADGTTEAKAWLVNVSSIESDVTTLSIPASFYKTNTLDVKSYYKVAGFDANWAKAAGKKDITGKLTSLTIDGTNMGNLANAFTGLEKLTTVKVTSKNDSWTNEGYVTGHLATLAAQIESLDLSGMEKVTATQGTLKGADWPKLTTVVLPSKLETLGKNFFEGSKITTIELPTTIKVIGDDAFTASELTALNLNKCEALVSIGVRAFYKAEKLAKLQMSGLKDGDKFTTIGAAAFAETAIPAANIPASVTTVGAWAFENCKKLTQVSAMAGLTLIDDYVFRGCEALESVSINKNITSIGAQAFKGCKALATVNFKADPKAAVLTTIADNAFEGCEALTAIDLTATAITNVEGTTFVGCKALAEVKLPATVTNIEAQAFGDCVIENLDLSETGITKLYAIFRHSDGNYPDAKKPYSSLKSIILPEGLDRIMNYASTGNGVFQYCTSLEEITIPTNVEKWGGTPNAVPGYAFYYCTALKTVNYTPTVVAAARVFNMEAFLGCIPFVYIKTNSYYWNTYSVPTNATFGSTTIKVTTVADKGTSGKFFAKFCPITDVEINPEDAKVYSVYVDEGTAFFQALIKRNGMYQIEAGDHVIIKTDEAKEVSIMPNGSLNRSVTVDDIFTLATDTPTSDVQDGTALATYGPCQSSALVSFSAGTDYIYRLTNNAATGGFGFTFFPGATMKADQFFIISDINPNAAGRLQTVWLDENGFVEEDGATAIQKVEAAEAENGAIYNLQGVRVKAAKKGLYIQNGKKYIMK